MSKFYFFFPTVFHVYLHSSIFCMYTGFERTGIDGETYELRTMFCACVTNKDKNVSDRFPIRNGLKQGDALSPMLFNFALDKPLGGFR